MNTDFDFILFGHNASEVEKAVSAGIRSFMVDCEWRGKNERQVGADTEIAPTEISSVRAVSDIAQARPYCRINGFGHWTPSEVEHAINCGAKRIFLPMAESPEEVEHFLQQLDKRAEAAILVETEGAVRCLRSLANLPIDAVYVGLNDLAISRGSRSIFAAVADGTVERVREAFPSIHFGFGGITVVDAGLPVPCRMLMKEMARLGCSFGFMRRSFRRDIEGLNMKDELNKLYAYWSKLLHRTRPEIVSDHEELIKLIQQAGLG